MLGLEYMTAGKDMKKQVLYAAVSIPDDLEEQGYVMLTGEPECNETDVRLEDGTTKADGRVEICLDGLWGSVCDSGWDSRDARVVCRQLGHDGGKFSYQTAFILVQTLAASVALLRHHVTNGSLFYHLDDVRCSGYEIKLNECEHHSTYVQYCRTRINEAGVTCNGELFDC